MTEAPDATEPAEPASTAARPLVGMSAVLLARRAADVIVGAGPDPTRAPLAEATCTTTTRRELVGSGAAEFHAEDMHAPTCLASFKGKVIVVNFGRRGPGPARRRFPDLSAEANYGDDRAIRCVVDDTPEQISPTRRIQINYTL